MIGKVIGLTAIIGYWPHHPFRRNKKAFRIGEVETDRPPPRVLQTPSQVWRRVKD